MENILGGGTEVLRHPWAAAAIFCFTFIMISFRKMHLLPVGRPAAALTGAVLMVFSDVVTPEEAFRLVNWDTICLLLGMMIIAEHLRAAALFDRFAVFMGRFSSPFGLLIALSIISGLSAAILVNDPVCVVMTPLVIQICRRRRLNPFPYLMILATSTNIGSALTLTGNPQNMIIGTISGFNYLKFFLIMALPVALALGINLCFAWFYYRKDLLLESAIATDAQTDKGESGEEPIEKTRKMRLGIAGLTLACLGFISGYSMSFSALAGAVVVITFHRRDPSELFARMEWSLLLFFASLFVVIGGLQTSGLAYLLTGYSMKLVSGELIYQVISFSGVTLIGSNILSNVPYILLASPSVMRMTEPELFWCLLAYVSTMAGNMTLFGAVANMIVAETARDDCNITFWGYARFGIPSTLIAMTAGIYIIYNIFAHGLIPVSP